MRPEDIDKLFKERLGNTSPTPPTDLWNRLQERIETEMPQPEEEEKKPVFILCWLTSHSCWNAFLPSVSKRHSALAHT